MSDAGTGTGGADQSHADLSEMADEMSASLSHTLKLTLVPLKAEDLPKWREECQQQWSGVKSTPLPQVQMTVDSP